MPEILIAACPPVGHVAPLLNVARGLVARGDRVTVLTSARHADRIRAVGAEPRPLPFTADYDDSTLDADLPGRAETSGIARINFDIEHIFVRPLPHQYSALQELLAADHYDAVIVDAMFLGALPLLLDESAQRPPILSYSTTPLFLSSRDTAPGGPGITPMPGTIGRLRNRLLTFATQKILLRPAHRAADRMLEVMGLPELPVFVLECAALADRVIVPTIPQFEYHRSDLPAHVRFVGAVNPLPSDNFIAPSWWGRLNGDRPVVHVTQGTIDNADLTRLVEPAIEALAGEDLTVVVTNGGYGAVQRALSDGVPMVVAGQTEDKPEVAARVEYFGAGINLRTGTPTSADVRRAVHRVLDDGTYRANARRLQSAYAERDSVAAVAAVVDEAIAEKTVLPQAV